MDRRSRLLDEIIERELAMFLATPNEGGTASCQERPDTFRLMRKMAHGTHGEDYLESYLQDLIQAEFDKRNFMLEKYARMDNRLPPISYNPLLDKIADAEQKFLEEAIPLTNGMIRPESAANFRNYLRCELETLSDRTLELYYKEIEQALRENVNPVLQRHNWLQDQLSKQTAN